MGRLQPFLAAVLSSSLLCCLLIGSSALSLQRQSDPMPSPPANSSSDACPPFNFRGRNFTFDMCAKLGKQGNFRLWWTIEPNNVTRVAFQGLPEQAWAWAGWGVSPDGTGEMVGSYALVAYADHKAATSPGNTQTVRVKANIFFLNGTAPKSILPGATNGPIQLASDATAVDFVAKGKVVKMVTLVAGLTNQPMAVIWRGGKSVVDFETPLLGDHTNRKPQCQMVDFVHGTVTSVCNATVSNVTNSCPPFSFQGTNSTFDSCVQLGSQGDSSLWWSVDKSTNITTVAFQGVPEKPWAWASWGVSPDGSGKMVGSFVLVAYADYQAASGGNASAVRTTGNIFYLKSLGPDSFEAGASNGPIQLAGNGTQVEFSQQGTVVKLVSKVSGLTMQPMTLIWRGGASVLDYDKALLGVHDNKRRESQVVDFSQTNSTMTCNPSPVTGSTTSNPNQKIVHSWLAGIGFGVILPVGVLIARHVKVWLDPIWFYTHMSLQICGYILGVTGWSYGIWLKQQYPDIRQAPSWQFNHYCIGITIFCVVTLQIFTPILKPHKTSPVRLYWNLVHWLFGYSAIALSFAQVFLGFQILDDEHLSYGSWKTGFIIFICIWACLMLLLEPISWWRYRATKTYDDEDEEYDDEDEEDEEDGYDDGKPKSKSRRHDDDDDDEDQEEGEDEDEEDEEDDRDETDDDYDKRQKK